jgi:hypothetical protein
MHCGFKLDAAASTKRTTPKWRGGSRLFTTGRSGSAAACGARVECCDQEKNFAAEIVQQTRCTNGVPDMVGEVDLVTGWKRAPTKAASKREVPDFVDFWLPFPVGARGFVSTQPAEPSGARHRAAVQLKSCRSGIPKG